MTFEKNLAHETLRNELAQITREGADSQYIASVIARAAIKETLTADWLKNFLLRCVEEDEFITYDEAVRMNGEISRVLKVA